MIKIETKIDGAFIIKPVFHEDDRGTFYTTFNRDIYNNLGILNLNIAQINTSISHKNVLRGLHYQVGFNAQAKLVWVSHGKVQDVFVDLREDSPTFGQWDSVDLIPNGNRLFIPKGCAHGFLTLERGTEFNYCCSNSWNKEAERTLIWNDPDVNINWKWLDDLIISPKDLAGISFKYCEKYRET
jgi:dTDP-4-dehydrorhamnose 3,5-epimerase